MWWWYLSRSSGIVATVLMVASLVWGLRFSARATGNRLRANWWLAMHNWLGGLSLAFLGVHLLAAFLDSGAGMGVAQLFVPGTAKGREWAITWGVIATYITVLVVCTSPARIRKHIPKPLWYGVHLTSIVGVVLSLVHAVQSGSDAQAAAFTAGLALLVGLSVYPAALRLLGMRDAARARAGR